MNKRLLYGSIVACLLLLSCVGLYFAFSRSEATADHIHYQADGYPDLTGKHLIVYASARDDVARAYLELFKQHTGCTYEYMRMPTQEALARIRDERHKPQADIFLGGSNSIHLIAKKEQLIEPYTSRYDKDIPAIYKDSEHYWTGIGASPLAIMINTRRWQRDYASKGYKLPQTYEDLLNPAFAKDIIISNPNTSSTAFTFLIYLNSTHSTEQFIHYLEGLKHSVGEFTVDGFTPAQKVGVGEYTFGISFLNDQLAVEASGFKMLNIVPQNTPWNIEAVSKIRNAPNGSVGNYFIDFCTNPQIQEQVNRISYSLPTTEKVASYHNIKLPKPDTASNLSFTGDTSQYKKLLTLWQDIIS